MFLAFLLNARVNLALDTQGVHLYLIKTARSTRAIPADARTAAKTAATLGFRRVMLSLLFVSQGSFKVAGADGVGGAGSATGFFMCSTQSFAAGTANVVVAPPTAVVGLS